MEWAGVIFTHPVPNFESTELSVIIGISSFVSGFTAYFLWYLVYLKYLIFYFKFSVSFLKIKYLSSVAETANAVSPNTVSGLVVAT